LALRTAVFANSDAADGWLAENNLEDVLSSTQLALDRER
jgi:hypothetical protein